jgi:hypothetical protein
MSLRYFARFVTMFGAIGIILSASKPTSALAEELYPWCIQSDTLHCYYMTREQCEEAVDYHGFCVANPETPRRLVSAD